MRLSKNFNACRNGGQRTWARRGERRRAKTSVCGGPPAAKSFIQNYQIGAQDLIGLRQRILGREMISLGVENSQKILKTTLMMFPVKIAGLAVLPD